MTEEENLSLKAPTFNGLEEAWHEWSFIMRAYIAGRLPQGQELIAAAEGTASDISNATIAVAGEQLLQENKKLFFTLVMTAKGPAQAILRS